MRPSASAPLELDHSVRVRQSALVPAGGPPARCCTSWPRLRTTWTAAGSLWWACPIRPACPCRARVRSQADPARIQAVLQVRLGSPPPKWRNVYKVHPQAAPAGWPQPRRPGPAVTHPSPAAAVKPCWASLQLDCLSSSRPLQAPERAWPLPGRLSGRRPVLQALTVLEFLLRGGSLQCVHLARSDLDARLQELQKFEATSTEGQDLGVNVRVRCAGRRGLRSARVSSRRGRVEPSSVARQLASPAPCMQLVPNAPGLHLHGAGSGAPLLQPRRLSRLVSAACAGRRRSALFSRTSRALPRSVLQLPSAGKPDSGVPGGPACRAPAACQLL